MSQLYHVRMSPRASRDLEQIHDFIENDSPQNARTVLLSLLDAIDSLDHLPQRYPIYQSDNRLRNHVHVMPVMTFVVYYRVFEQQQAVKVIAVQHGARQRPQNLD